MAPGEKNPPAEVNCPARRSEKTRYAKAWVDGKWSTCARRRFRLLGAEVVLVPALVSRFAVGRNGEKLVAGKRDVARGDGTGGSGESLTEFSFRCLAWASHSSLRFSLRFSPRFSRKYIDPGVDNVPRNQRASRVRLFDTSVRGARLGTGKTRRGDRFLGICGASGSS